MARKFNKTSRMGRPAINDETKKLVCRLYDEDQMTCKEIAAATNIGLTSLYNIVKGRKEANGKEE